VPSKAKKQDLLELVEKHLSDAWRLAVSQFVWYAANSAHFRVRSARQTNALHETISCPGGALAASSDLHRGQRLPPLAIQADPWSIDGSTP